MSDIHSGQWLSQWPLLFTGIILSSKYQSSDLPISLFTKNYWTNPTLDSSDHGPACIAFHCSHLYITYINVSNGRLCMQAYGSDMFHSSASANDLMVVCVFFSSLHFTFYSSPKSSAAVYFFVYVWCREHELKLLWIGQSVLTYPIEISLTKEEL